MVCKSLRSAVDSDVVWEKFLPSDYKSIILGSSSPSSLLSLGKKELYLQLCFHPILLQNGIHAMSFQLQKGSGKICYMLGARAIYIWGEIPGLGNWNWISQPDSRFPEVAELVEVWWLAMTGQIETKILSPNTNYSVYFVFKFKDTDVTGFRHRTVSLHVDVDRAVSSSTEERRVSLDPLDQPRHIRERRDGWMEAKMGEFYNELGYDRIVEFSLKNFDTRYKKRGLIIEGIEVRPLDISS